MRRPPPPPPPPPKLGDITEAALAAYNGYDVYRPYLLVAVRGAVYDVSRDRALYGPGKPCSPYAGREISRRAAPASSQAELWGGRVGVLSGGEAGLLARRCRFLLARLLLSAAPFSSTPSASTY